MNDNFIDHIFWIMEQWLTTYIRNNGWPRYWVVTFGPRKWMQYHMNQRSKRWLASQTKPESKDIYR